MLRRDLRYGLSHPKATLHTLLGTRISGNVNRKQSQTRV
ncbi:Protein of unknown function [Leuconostoc citreum LBAE C11]|nr:Protein of unknown function [Leuconostoc citreum LBAE C11]